MTDELAIQACGLALTLSTFAVGVHRYINTQQKDLRVEWERDLTKIDTRVDKLDTQMQDMRDKLATKDDLTRVEKKVDEMAKGLSHQGALEERITAMGDKIEMILRLVSDRRGSSHDYAAP
jgi:predicted  nucleic acid-binding Zn-ribbon protein